MQNAIDLKVYAKINLSLNIVGLSGSMHLLDSIVASVNIYDAISICLRDDNVINIQIDNPSIPKTNNSVTKALAVIMEQIGSFGANISISKNIPIAAGLGGSSADAAGVILGLDKLLNLSARGLDIAKIAAKTGSDTAYMLKGGYARMSGTGSIIQQIESDLLLHLVLASPNQASLSSAVYKKFDNIYKDGIFTPSNNQKIIDALTCKSTDYLNQESTKGTDYLNQDTLKNKNNLNISKTTDDLYNQRVSVIAENTGNALFQPAVSLCPEIGEVYDQIKKLSLTGPTMTGSGSMIVALFKTADEAKKTAENLQKHGIFAINCTTIKQGIEIINQ